MKDILLKLNLHLFDGNTNVTGDVALSDEMKVYYSDYLIDMAEPKLVHDQFAQKHPIPEGKGKTIEFRKYDPLPKMLTPLTEGVTPDGQKLSMGVITAEVKQYGGYIELSDILLLTAIDNNLVQATKLLGSQAGRTLDTITREELSGGTNVQFGEDAVAGRHLLKGGGESNHYITVDAIRRAVRKLKVMNAETIDGTYCAIIHPDCSYDLMSDPKWINVKTYSDPDGMYNGEIGKIENVRFVESSEAKVFHADDLTAESRNLTVSAVNNTVVTVKEAIGEVDALELLDRMVLIGGSAYTVKEAKSGAAGAGTITLDRKCTAEADAVIYPGEAGAEGRDVYSTLIIADNAYGTTDISDGGLRHIIKQLGSAGTADPLDQRATAGWKATKAAKRLVEAYMVRIETASTFEVGAN